MKIKLEIEKVDHNLSKNGLRSILRRPDRNLRFFEAASIFAKIAKNPLFPDFHQISNLLKILTRNALRMVGTSFESLWSKFFEKINCINKLCIFVPFCNQNGIHGSIQIENYIIQFWLQKGTKMHNLLMQFIFSKNMDLKLSKNVPGMLKSFLERILSFFEIW